MRRSHNIGATRLRGRRRSADPMRTFDALPAPLRQWLSEAVLPWSPASVKRVWTLKRARGVSPDEILASLSQAETRTLARDKQATPQT